MAIPRRFELALPDQVAEIIARLAVVIDESMALRAELICKADDYRRNNRAVPQALGLPKNTKHHR